MIVVKGVVTTVPLVTHAHVYTVTPTARARTHFEFCVPARRPLCEGLTTPRSCTLSTGALPWNVNVHRSIYLHRNNSTQQHRPPVT